MNFITLISRRRWSKRLFQRWLPPINSANLHDGFKIFYNPRDMQGPSFHFSYDLDRGFYNYEQADRKFLLDLCPPNSVLYDVGANIGLFSLYAAKTRNDLTIHAFEPDPEVYRCLELSIKSNNLDHIQLHAFGLGEQDNILPLYQHHTNDGGHTLVAPAQDELMQSKSVVIKSLDSCLELKLFAPPDVIKIDVEGFEADCLKGMSKTIFKHRPSLMVECLNTNLVNKSELQSLFKQYQDNGAHFYSSQTQKIMNLDELIELAAIRLNAGKDHDNYFALFKK
jgi:FkbM family methyltransferase